MNGLFRNVGPSLQRTLWVLVGLHFGANVLRHAVEHPAFEDLMTLATVLALGGMCVGAFLGLLARKRHAFAAALIAHGFIALDARYLHRSLVSVGEVVGKIPDIPHIDIVAIVFLLAGWCAVIAMQLGFANLIVRNLPWGWETPLWKGRQPEAKIFLLPDQRRPVSSRSA